MSAQSQPQEAETTEPDTEYVIGPTHPRTNRTARLETKPSTPGYTGGGYEHWRSFERRPHTPGTDKEHVYASVHRLTAVVACYDSDEPLAAVLDDLRGKDVHHRSGVPWDNRPSNLEVRGHGEHASITQTQRRAWAQDKKRQVEQEENRALDGQQRHCDRCGKESELLAECDAWNDDPKRCVECASETSVDGHPIRL